jgi:type VI secretion system protein ImpE
VSSSLQSSSIAESKHLKYTAEKSKGGGNMGAKELFDAGNLSGALDQLTQEVKSNPRDLRRRIFLFELLCFTADYQRAERQLDAIAQTSDDVKVEMGAQVYRNALQAEKARHAFFTGANRLPSFFSEPPNYAAFHIEAMNHLRENRFEELEDVLSKSEKIYKPPKGKRDGSAFENFTDGDDLIGPFLEVFVQAEYFWLPLDQIKRLEIRPPRTLRDLIWIPASIDLFVRSLSDVFIPVQYFGSHRHPDDLVKLGRMTDWKTVGQGTLLGAGQRTFFADETECPLLEIRTIEFALST